ncbi:MAG: DegT/DnrJ/EryC1/StrS family aminotransferase [Candidatus Nealsonbacteria bacterium]
MYFVHPQIKLNKVIKAGLSLMEPISLGRIATRLSPFLPEKQFIFTDMGRTAFRLIIEKMNLRNSEMLLPAYICDIFHPILKEYNIKPIFLDIDLKTFHIQPSEIKQKISVNTRAILVCHTYGLPLNVGAIREAVGQNATIIEDCAHSFFTQKRGVYAGNAGDISFFSLYKQFPALRGGMLACPKEWDVKLLKTYFNFRDFISFLNYFWPFAFFFKKFGSEVAIKIPRKEKRQELGGINRASLSLFSDFFGDARDSLTNRKKLAELFQEELKGLGFEAQESAENVFCYLSVLVPKAMRDQRDKIVQELKKHRVFCTRIWHAPIILNEDVQKEYQINPADFPNTVEAAGRIINFPLQNHYTEKDIRKMVEAVKKVIIAL